MLLPAVLLTVLFICIAFISNQPQQTHTVFFTYYFSEIQFVLDHLLAFICGFIGITVIFMGSIKFEKHHTLHKKYAFSTLHMLQVTLLGFFLAYILLFFIAVIELNMLALFINLKPSIVGLMTDKQRIVTTLEKNNRPPKIIASDTDQHNELLAVAFATTGKNNFYGNYVLASIPRFLVIPIQKPKSSILLIDNTIIITNINPIDIQTISPVIGFIFVKHYFPDKYIKPFPVISVMSQQEYQRYRKLETDKQLIQIDREITTLETMMSSISAVSQNQLSTYAYYDNFFKTQRKILQTQNQHVPHELGIFEPENAIKIVIDHTNAHAIADYFETVTHEYLHYTSYVSEKKKLADPFFEEGLTEYFARMTIKDTLHTSTNLGYPVFVKIITEMTNLIPESELADIYFTKDESQLEATLDRVYGDDFYKNNRILFESLEYSSDRHQTLKLANEIMKKIGGTPLKEKDLQSSYSNL